MKRYVAIVVTLLICLGLVLPSCATPAEKAPQTPAEFYQDKTIEYLIPASVGGGGDTSVRLQAPWLEKYTGAKVYPVSMPGGGTMLAPDYLYTTAKPDGLTISLSYGHVLAGAQLSGLEDIHFDVAKFEWLACIRKHTGIFAVNAKLPYQTLDDLIKADREITVSAQGVGDHSSQVSNFILKPLGVKARPVYGFPGATEMAVSCARGEVDATCQSPTKIYALVQEGLIRPIFAIGSERSVTFPDVPNIYEVLPADAPEKAKAWTDVIVSMEPYFTIAAPPGTPKDRVEFLREAFKNMMGEKTLIDRLEQALLEPEFTPGEEVQKAFGRIMALSPEMLKEFRDIVEAAK